MTDILNVAIEGIKTLAKWLTERKIKGKRVKLITKSTIYQSSGLVEPTIVSQVLEGRVDGVFANPPGLVLENAVRYLKTETTHIVDLAVNMGEKKSSVREFVPITKMSPPEHLRRVVQLFSALERIEFFEDQKDS